MIDRDFRLRPLVRLILVCGLLAVPLRVAEAATRTWSATPGSNNMSTGSNWVGGVAPVAGDDIVFTGTSTIMTLNYDLASTPNSITFQSTGWILTGPANMVVGVGGIRCTVGGGATNTISVTTQAVGVPLNLDAVSGCTLRFANLLLGSTEGVSIGEFGGTGTIQFDITNQLGGVIRVRSGLLHCVTNGCFRNSGNTEGSGTVIESGGAVRTVGNIENEYLTLNGGSGLGGGAIFADSSSNWFAPITINVTTAVGGSGDLAFIPGVTGAGGLTKVGTGTMSLSLATATYTGPTLVTEGRLNLNGPNATSSTTVQSGATLGGIGTITNGATINSGGSLAPGLSAGILNTGNLVLSPGSTLEAEINGTTPGTDYDQVNVTGSVSVSGATLSLVMGFVPALGNTFTLINNDGADAVAGTFSGLAEGAVVAAGGANFTISYIGGTGNDVVLTAVEPVPAMPSMLLLVLVALALVALSVRRLQQA